MTPLIDMRHITKRYGQKTALNHVNIRIEAGKIIGLIGSNGSGKTTWLKLLAGLVQQTEGELYVDGKKIGKETKAVVSYLPDSPRFDDWIGLSAAFSDFLLCGTCKIYSCKKGLASYPCFCVLFSYFVGSCMAK